MVTDGPLTERLTDAYRDSLSKVVTAPNFLDLVIELMAEFDEALGVANNELLIDRLEAMSLAGTVALSCKAITLLQELDTAVRLR